MTDDTKKVVVLPGAKGDYDDHGFFLDLVKSGIEERPVETTIVLVLDRNGKHTLHCSTANTERVIAMLVAALDHSKNMWAHALSELTDGGDDSTAA